MRTQDQVHGQAATAAKLTFGGTTRVVFPTWPCPNPSRLHYLQCNDIGVASNEVHDRDLGLHILDVLLAYQLCLGDGLNCKLILGGWLRGYTHNAEGTLSDLLAHRVDFIYARVSLRLAEDVGDAEPHCERQRQFEPLRSWL